MKYINILFRIALPKYWIGLPIASGYYSLCGYGIKHTLFGIEEKIITYKENFKNSPPPDVRKSLSEAEMDGVISMFKPIRF